MVVTDMTEARRNEEMLRALTHRVVQAQEAERGRVALELHDNITQLLCAILVRSQTLADKLPAREGPAKNEALKLRECWARPPKKWSASRATCGRVSWNNWVWSPSCRTPARSSRSGQACPSSWPAWRWPPGCPRDIELTLYRILQEALKNVEKHATARHVTVCLTKPAGFIQLVIHDDGIGFDPDHLPVGRKGRDGLGLLSMRERAAYVDGALKVKSVRRAGTQIEVLIPLPATPTAKARGASPSAHG